MKKLPVFLVVMTLIVGNLFSAMHVHAGGVGDDAGIQIIKAMGENSDSNDSTNFVECNQCCHAGSHIAMNNKPSTNHDMASIKHFTSSSESYLSQLNSPPFQPPRV